MNFPGDALVNDNAGIPCSAGLKAVCPYGLLITQRLIIQVRLTGSLLTSNFLERFEKGSMKQVHFVAPGRTVCVCVRLPQAERRVSTSCFRIFLL